MISVYYVLQILRVLSEDHARNAVLERQASKYGQAGPKSGHMH